MQPGISQSSQSNQFLNSSKILFNRLPSKFMCSQQSFMPPNGSKHFRCFTHVFQLLFPCVANAFPTNHACAKNFPNPKTTKSRTHIRTCTSYLQTYIINRYIKQTAWKGSTFSFCPKPFQQNPKTCQIKNTSNHTTRILAPIWAERCRVVTKQSEEAQLLSSRLFRLEQSE